MPTLQHVFDTTSLALWQVALVVPFPFLVWGVDELRRWRDRRASGPGTPSRAEDPAGRLARQP